MQDRDFQLKGNLERLENPLCCFVAAQPARDLQKGSKVNCHKLDLQA